MLYFLHTITMLGPEVYFLLSFVYISRRVREAVNNVFVPDLSHSLIKQGVIVPKSQMRK